MYGACPKTLKRFWFQRLFAFQSFVLLYLHKNWTICHMKYYASAILAKLGKQRINA